jgi:hypothetical protein
MEKQMSVVKHENQILPGFRNKINLAESIVDVSEFFDQAIRALMVNIFQDNTYQDFDAITLSPEAEPFFKLDKSSPLPREFFALWKNSDLPHIIGRLAEAATHRYRHLEKKPGKTEKKIRN